MTFRNPSEALSPPSAMFKRMPTRASRSAACRSRATRRCVAVLVERAAQLPERPGIGTPITLFGLNRNSSWSKHDAKADVPGSGIDWDAETAELQTWVSD